MKTVYRRKLHDNSCDTRDKCSECKKKCPQFWKKTRKRVMVHLAKGYHVVKDSETLHKQPIIRKIVHFRCGSIEVEKCVMRFVKNAEVPFDVLFFFSYVWQPCKNFPLNELEIEVFDL